MCRDYAYTMPLLGCKMKLTTEDFIFQGFARYSTDERWHVPHFEKMLYDQAQLAVAYVNGYLITKKPSFADTVIDILTYVSRDLSHEVSAY